LTRNDDEHLGDTLATDTVASSHRIVANDKVASASVQLTSHRPFACARAIEIETQTLHANGGRARIAVHERRRACRAVSLRPQRFVRGIGVATMFGMLRMAAAVIVFATLVPTDAIAEPIGEDNAPRAAPTEPTASDVEGQPVPGQESGRLDSDDGDSTARKLGRGALWLPKMAVEAAFAPVRAGVWAYGRYHLYDRALALFFNDDRTLGLYPVAQLESQYGINVGARFLARDLAGEREHLSLHAGAGGRFRQIASAKLRSGNRFGSHVGLELDTEFERRPKDAFYGLGNTNDGSVVPGVVEARFREQLLRAAATADFRLVANLHVRFAGALADFELGRSEQGPPIDELYPMDVMVGFGGVRHGYGELELRWDSRRSTTFWDLPAMHTTGWLVAGYAGRVTALDAGADYWRFGADLQRFVRLGSGSRVIAGRLYGETVTGSLDEVPFTQLPRLGGKTLLRGYPLDRFRDRAATMGSVEYFWDLSRFISASTFVDVGRVFPSLPDVSSKDLRVGYGLSLQAYTTNTFLLRASLASSIDGGVFLDLAFDPVFELDPRVERR
jgi:hypothetical protein